MKKIIISAVLAALAGAVAVATAIIRRNKVTV